MSKTAETLGKLSERQAKRLDSYRRSMLKNYAVGDDEKYRNRIHGYISALEDSGIISTVETRVLRIYFTR